MVLVDANVILDIWNGDPAWSGWSQGQLRSLSLLHELVIDPVIYAEISVSFTTPGLLDKRVDELGLKVLNLTRPAAFLAGKAYAKYRRLGGTRSNVLADFFIGAHAAVLGCELLTRDARRYAAYFPSVGLIHP